MHAHTHGSFTAISPAPRTMNGTYLLHELSEGGIPVKEHSTFKMVMKRNEVQKDREGSFH